MHLNKLVLIGFMGSGKSTLAPLLAKQLGFIAVDADAEIVKCSGFSSVSEIFSVRGEEHFRDLEALVCASFRDASSFVIAAGGGVIVRPDNMKHLSHGGGIIVFLDTSFEEVTRRITEINSRPLFKSSAGARTIYNHRLSIYRQYADYTVQTDGKSSSDVCSEILSSLEQYR